MPKASVIREKLTYLRTPITSDFNPCHDEISPFEHVLSCGHLVTTPTPKEQCAPNCCHVAREERTTVRRKMLKNMSRNDFYCDACVEEDAEKEIPASLSCKEAEKYRIRFRKTTAAVRDKANKFRNCYIAQKTIAVPCDKHGDPVKAYDPHPSPHPFDTAWPPTGDNMFEDIKILPTECIKRKKKQRPSVWSSDEPESEPSGAEDGDTEDVDETVAEGAGWLQEQEELEQRRAEERTRRRRAAAHPTIISSSPDTEMSDFVIDTHKNPRSTTPAPEAPQKNRGRR